MPFRICLGDKQADNSFDGDVIVDVDASPCCMQIGAWLNLSCCMWSMLTPCSVTAILLSAFLNDSDVAHSSHIFAKIIINPCRFIVMCGVNKSCFAVL